MISEVEERIAGEAVRLRITIGVHEKVAEVEDSTVKALDRLRLGSVKLTRLVIREGAIASGIKTKQDVDKWLDDLWERGGQAPLSMLAFSALANAYAKAAEAADEAGEPKADQAQTAS